jgi:16S rRNA (uracil1498-N3)-methyltransferase
MQYFFYDNLEGSAFAFGEEESKHCIKVLRHKRGDTLQLIDGKGNWAEALIEEDHPKHCSGKITKRVHHAPTLPYHFTLSIAPTKQHERMDWLVEKAVEMGVHCIQFIQCKNSERPKINLDRLHKIAISALKQSKQFYLPTFKPLVPLETALATATQDLKLMAYCLSAQDQSLYAYLQQRPSNIHLLVGPEGDFTPAEVAQAQAQGFAPCSLGPHILRTETAALYALAATAAVLGQTKNESV